MAHYVQELNWMLTHSNAAAKFALALVVLVAVLFSPVGICCMKPMAQPAHHCCPNAVDDCTMFTNVYSNEITPVVSQNDQQAPLPALPVIGHIQPVQLAGFNANPVNKGSRVVQDRFLSFHQLLI